MTVTAEYAQSHLHELLSAAEHGEQVEITRDDGFAVKLVSERAPVKTDRTNLFGALKGKMWLTDDWDASSLHRPSLKTCNLSLKMQSSTSMK